MKKLAILVTGVASAAFLFSSCNGGGGSSDDGAAAAGPATAAAFTGATVAFNPTVTFLANGQLTYFNDEDGSPFDQADPAIGGTYTYDPSSDFTSGVLAITLSGSTDTDVINVSNFVVVDGSVTGFTLTFTDQGSFTATVTQGTIPAYVPPSTGGGGGSGGGSGAENFTFESNGNIAAGTSFSKEYLSGNSQGNISNTPLRSYNTGESVPFSVSASGALEFSGKTQTLSLPFLGASDGIISYSGNYNGGGVTVVFDTGATSAQSDFTMTWNGPVDISNPSAIAIDGKAFKN